MKFEKKPPCSGSTEGALLQESCYKITGCAIDILNLIGPGLSCDVYISCLKIEMDKRGISYHQNTACSLVYDGENVGTIFVPFVVADCLIVDCIVADDFNETDYSQFISYLRALDLPMALLLNFQFGKLQWKKIVLERS